MSRLSAERLEGIKADHEAWIYKESVSRGQLKDSETILELLAHIDSLQTELDELDKDFHQMVSDKDKLYESLQAENEKLKRVVEAARRAEKFLENLCPPDFKAWPSGKRDYCDEQVEIREALAELDKEKT